MKYAKPLVTIVVPSYNQGCFLEKALTSIFEQNITSEVYVMDGGSTDNSVEIIHKWKHKLAGWRSHFDNGQSMAINEGVARGSAPYVCWLNSDDMYLPTSLSKLIYAMENNKLAPAVYGRCWNLIENSGKLYPIRVEEFSELRLARRCIISQPATLIRRSAWDAVGGIDANLHMAMDYDLWWKLFKQIGELHFVDDYIAINRDHDKSKTNTQRFKHYKEAITVVRKHYGSVPLRWWMAQPYSVWFKSIIN